MGLVYGYTIGPFLTPICILVGWHVPAVEIKVQSYLKMYILIWLVLETLDCSIYCT
jgi:hypothetical protein